MGMKLLSLVLVACLTGGESSLLRSAAGANPIRKVVTMLQNLQKRVEAEGAAEKELFDKYMCYCKNGAGTLGKAIEAANTKMPQVASDIKEAESKKTQTEEELATHQSDRDAAKSAMAQATSIREKEAAEYAKEKADADANIDALTKATAAIEKGVAGGFLQTNAAQVLRRLTLAKEDMMDADRKEIMAFLSSTGSSDYSPQSGEITGILKQLNDEMSKARADATAAEQGAVKSFAELMAAKKKEISAATSAIETKTARVGELGVSIVQMKNDLSDTDEQLMEDKKFSADLQKNCAQKEAEWGEMVKTRGEEIVALSETIKILNDDDALELFKKTLPTPSASFIQVKEGQAARARALKIIRQAARPQLDFIVLAIQGKKIGFEKVIKMIDNMVANLKQEQLDDNNKRETCSRLFDNADDKKKSLERSVEDLETAIADAKEGVSTTATEIEALKEGISTLDKSVAEATEQRKAENADFKELISQNSAAKQLLGMAKNRMNKFYNPKLYKAPPKVELSEAGRIEASMAFVQLHEQDAPAPPPEGPAYAKKSEENSGVLAMIDLLAKDLEKEMTEARTEEKDAQSDYEQTMTDSADKRALDTKALTEKEGTRADLQADLEAHKENKASTAKELGATLQYIHSLHADCDWLLKYFDTRKEARAGEIDALGNAKAVLSGADFN